MDESAKTMAAAMMSSGDTRLPYRAMIPMDSPVTSPYINNADAPSALCSSHEVAIAQAPLLSEQASVRTLHPRGWRLGTFGDPTALYLWCNSVSESSSGMRL